MRPRSLTLAALGAGALLVSAPGAAQAATDCGALGAKNLKLTRDAAGTSVTVSWRAPRNASDRLAFRVARDGAVVGQTAKTSLAVRVSPGRAAKITVTAVLGGKATKCVARTRLPGAGERSGPPGAVRDLAVRPRGARSVKLTWGAAVRGTRPVARYRVLRGSTVVRTTRRRSITVSTAKARYRVVAVDTAGKASRKGNRVLVKRGHAAPTAPTAPAASDTNETSALLSWAPSRAVGSKIARYRVVRRGRTVASTKRTSVRVKGLKKGKRATFRVVAADRLGWASKPSDKVTVVAGHSAPGAPGAPSATAVTDTSLSLAWAASQLPTGSKLRGYRLMRDGKVVSQVPAAQANIGNLAANAVHDWSVAAVDTLGYVSAPSPASRIAQGAPEPTQGGVHAFLLASTDASFARFREQYRRVSVVYPTFFDCNRSTGAIEGANNAQIVSFAQARKVKVLPRFNCQNTATLHRIFSEPALRAQWIDSIVAQAVQHGWDGVNIDFEAGAAEDRNLMTSFIADLSDRLHAQGKLLSQAVSAKAKDSLTHPRNGIFDYPELAKYNDWIFVMAWGVHWSTSTPGAQDDFPWVRSVADYVASMPNREKWVMGTMLYGMDWPNGGGSAANEASGLHWPEIQSLIAQHGQPVFDAEANSYHLAYQDGAGVPHDLWFSDAEAVGDRVALARERGLKVGFWRLGQEDPAVWTEPRLPIGG
jgi:spore germination protein YaaH